MEKRALAMRRKIANEMQTIVYWFLNRSSRIHSDGSLINFLELECHKFAKFDEVKRMLIPTSKRWKAIFQKLSLLEKYTSIARVQE